MRHIFPTIILLFLFVGCSSDDSPIENNQSGTASLSTNVISSITSDSAISGGVISDDGGEPITSKGVCWSTSPNPTIGDSKTNEGGGTGSFVSQLTGLNEGETYYVRSYATNTNGTSYGNQVQFNTVIANIFQGSISLYGQIEVDEFVANNYTEITGELEILDVASQGQPIIDVSGFESLIKVGGLLSIINTNLTDLEGFNSLASVGGLFISSNNLLQSIEALHSITEIGISGLAITNLSTGQNLPSIEGLNNIQTIAGDLRLTYLPNEDMQVFSQLESIGGNLQIERCYNLNSLNGLENLTTIGSGTSGILIWENELLENIQGLSNLNQFSGYIGINDNLSLSSIQGLEGVIMLSSLSIQNSPLLTSIQSLSNLTSSEISDLFLEDLNSLNSLEGLESLTSIVGNLNIRNTNITSLAPIANINTIGNDVNISGNNNLISINELTALGTLNNNLVVAGENITEAGILNTITSLNSLGFGCATTELPFNSLVECNGLSIIGNHNISSMAGLNNLTTVTGIFRILNNNNLEDLIGLENFTSIQTISGQSSGLYIEDNSSLISLDGLSNLASIDGSLNIFSNESLQDYCDIAGLILGNNITQGPSISMNFWNPNFTDFQDGNCSL